MNFEGKYYKKISQLLYQSDRGRHQNMYTSFTQKGLASQTHLKEYTYSEIIPES